MERSSIQAETVAGLARQAAERFGDAPSLRFKRGGSWEEMTFAQVADERRRARARPGRPRHRARRSGLPSSPTPAPSGPSSHGGLCRGGGRRPDLPDQLPQGVPVGRRQLRRPRRHLRGRRPAGQDRAGPRRAAGARAHDRHREQRRRDDARRPARPAGATATARSCAAAQAAVEPDDACIFIYTSGTTGPPKGVRAHAPQRRDDRHDRRGARVHRRRRGLLPLPAARPRLRPDGPDRLLRGRHDDRLFRRRHEADHPRAHGDPPDLLAVGPADLREALHAGHGAGGQGLAGGARADLAAIKLGVQGPRARAPRRAGPRRAASRLRGGRRGDLLHGARRCSAARSARRSAAPRRSRPRSSSSSTPRRPRARGLRADRDRPGSATVNTPSAQDRDVGKPVPRVRGPDRRRRRDPHARAEHLPRVLAEPRGDRRGLDRRRLVPHRRPRLARRGRASSDHRAQEGHHHHRRRQEPDPGQHRERPQAVALDLPGDHARRPPALPRRADHPRRGGDPALGRGAGPAGGRSPSWPPRTAGDRADPGGAGPRQLQVRPGRADQEVLHPRPGPLPGGGRADADPEGEAQRDQRRYAERFEAMYSSRS